MTLTHTFKRILGLTALGLVSVSVAVAQPTYDSFGVLPALTAGGTPGKNVAISTAASGGGTLTLGLSAQQRYFNAAVTDDGAGTFFATTGQNAGDLAHPTTTGVSPYKFLGSTWNFDFFIENTGTASLTYSISFGLAGGTVYTFDPTTDGDAGSGPYQDSQNLLFANFGGAVNGFAGSFDPNANATYDFLLTAKTAAGGTVAQSGIRVVVGTGGSVPDAGSTCAMLGMALAGIAGLRRKFVA